MTYQIDYIVKNCDNFLKLAMLEAPPTMVEDIYKKIKFIYSGAVFYYLNTLNDKTLEQEQLLEEVKKHISRPIAFNNDVTYDIPLNLNGWKHLNESFKNKIAELPKVLKLRLSKHPLKNNHLGVFSFTENSITIHIHSTNVNNIKAFNAALSDMKNTVRHELQHYSQLLLYSLAKLIGKNPKGYTFGFPPKKVQQKEEDVDHPLRDIEFYTTLQDSINLFKEKIFKIKPIYRKSFAKAWVGSSTELLDILKYNIEKMNLSSEQKRIKIEDAEKICKTKDPFNTLKNKSPSKWKIAVKHFMAQVGELL